MSPGSTNAGNAAGWTVILGVPTLPLAGLIVLGVVLLGAGRRSLRPSAKRIGLDAPVPGTYPWWPPSRRPSAPTAAAT